MMAFDVDENSKPHFKKLYPEYHCYEIHDALDIPKPLVITINPISRNCQFIYQVKYTEEEQLNSKATKEEYERIRRELSPLLGADRAFVNHVVRSPMFVAGHHRKNPNKTTSKKLIDIEQESLWHHSIWYDPHGYTLAELRQIISYLRDLLGEAVDPQHSVEKHDAETRHHQPSVTDANKLDISIQRQLAQTPSSNIHEGERNLWLFSNLSLNFCRKAGVAARFRKNNDFSGFMKAALAKTHELNNRLGDPQPEAECSYIAKSVVGWCMGSNYRPIGRTSEEATFISRYFRWGAEYISNEKKAKASGISPSTFYRRQISKTKLISKRQQDHVTVAFKAKAAAMSERTYYRGQWRNPQDPLKGQSFRASPASRALPARPSSSLKETIRTNWRLYIQYLHYHHYCSSSSSLIGILSKTLPHHESEISKSGVVGSAKQRAPP